MSSRFVIAACLLGQVTVPPAARAQEPLLADRVEIRRTEYGIPHILADDLAAAFFGLAYCHLEDYGKRVVHELVRSRGELARYFGADSLDVDFRHRQLHARAVQTYHFLDRDTRKVLEGYAAGINHYIDLHQGEFAPWVAPSFSGHDIAARWIGDIRWDKAREFVERLTATPADTLSAAPLNERGSNAWAFAPSRTRSGSTILLRNPHLDWDAGYYEAHLTVPDVLNFYGDFRVGHPLFFNGGFNDHLGWATTNNAPDLEEIYALEVDPRHPDHYWLDGSSVPLRRKTTTVEFRNGPGLGRVAREFWETPLGPVIHRGAGKIYVMRGAGEGEYRKVQQFLGMMQARNLDEWKNAMRLRAQTGSNFIYADRGGNIYYVWNASVPRLPHKPGGDSIAIPAVNSSQIWTDLVPFDSLPQLQNPPGGYLHNENDPFHYTNLNRLLQAADYPANFPQPHLGLRTQHSLKLIHGDRKLSLEDVVRLKHSVRMVAADRFKADLIRAARAAQADSEVGAAIGLLEEWDNTVGPRSRGAVLFQTWFRRYLLGDQPLTTSAIDSAWQAAFREPWSADDPTSTPRGLGEPARAVEALVWAAAKTKLDFGRLDVEWGEVHRLRRGSVDVPVGGCGSWLGCFRVLWFEEDEDGTRVAQGGDAWILAVQFTDPPRAYSVLAYGQSARPDSPHYDDQAEMFARGTLKRVAFTEAEIQSQLIRKYRPGSERDTLRN